MAKQETRTESFALEAVHACIQLADQRQAGSGPGEVRFSTGRKPSEKDRRFRLVVQLDGRERVTALCEVGGAPPAALHAKVTLISPSGKERDNLRFRCVRPRGGRIKIYSLTGPGSDQSDAIIDSRDYRRLEEALTSRFKDWDFWTIDDRTLGAWHKSWIFGHEPMVGVVEHVIATINLHYNTVFSS